MKESKQLLTEGSVPKKMLCFAIPIFFSNLFQQLYNAVDSLIVGNFIGGEALAAVGSSASLIMLLIGFINGVSLGAGVLIARLFGAQDERGLERAVHTTVALGLAAGAVLTVLGVVLSPDPSAGWGRRRTCCPARYSIFGYISWDRWQWYSIIWEPASSSLWGTAAAP